MAAPSRPRASSPALPGELVEEILLRLPPDDPACFLRASLVCKSWSSAMCLPSFRRRLHDLHRAAPVLGFLHDWYNPDIPDFIPTTASPFSLAAPDRRCWRALDCRHGRAVFLSKGQDAQALLVWEAITGAQRRVPVPTTFQCSYPTAAVFCAADGCDHCGCHVGPFCIVLVFAISGAYGTSASACLYSSETGTWGKITSSIQCELGVCFTECGSVIIQNSLMYFMSDTSVIMEYDVASHLLTVIDTPICGPRFNLMLTEDGGLGLLTDMDTHLELWSRNTRDGGDARWQLSRVIHLGNLHPFHPMVRIGHSAVLILAFAEGANVIFFKTDFGIFIMDLQSERVREVCGNHGFCNLIPVVNFYTPVSHGKHQDTIPLNLIEEAADEEWRGEQDNASQLDKASSAIEEYFVDTGLRHALEIRDLTCNNCRRPGHFARDCPSASTCNNCNLPGHFAAECTSKTVCWNCKKSGHIATECKNEALCHTCSKTGHLARDCPASGSNAKLCNNCFKPGHIAVDCTNDRACNNCRQPGHIARECNNDPVCNLCNVSGHLARSCPKTSTLASEIHGGPFRDISCRMCGQPGHISRNCMATVICDTCGGRGHMAYECPSARVFDCGVCRF